MISGIKTNAPRCPFQFYTRKVDRTNSAGDKITEERTEFAECVAERCMAYIKSRSMCGFVLRDAGVYLDIDIDRDEDVDG